MFAKVYEGNRSLDFKRIQVSYNNCRTGDTQLICFDKMKKFLLWRPFVRASIFVLSFFSVTNLRFSRVSLPLKFSQGKLPFVRYKRMFAKPSRSSLLLCSKFYDFTIHYLPRRRFEFRLEYLTVPTNSYFTVHSICLRVKVLIYCFARPKSTIQTNYSLVILES